MFEVMWIRRENRGLTDKTNLTVNIGRNRHFDLKIKEKVSEKKTGRKKF
jgi:hypothetical protein